MGPKIKITALWALILMLLVCFGGPVQAQAKPLKVAMLIPGHIDDGGFMQAGYNGLMLIKDQLKAEVSYIDKIKPKMDLLVAAIRKLAAQSPDMIIAHGGQNSKAMAATAPEYPDIMFVVVQGNVTGKNLSSYEILQEQSAWLAGAAAAMLTKTGTIGHISGIRVRPGLKGRAAFYSGASYVNPKIKYLTTFAGDQDDQDLAYKVAMAQIKAGADIIFTMLNAARPGAIKAMRENKVYQIGNVRDWYPDYPDVFIASAAANVSMAGLRAASDLKSGAFKPGVVVKIGLEDPNAVSLPLAPQVGQEVRAKLDDLKKKLASGEIKVSVEYKGPEFKF